MASQPTIITESSTYMDRFLTKLNENLVRPERFCFFLRQQLNDGQTGTPISFLADFANTLAPVKIRCVPIEPVFAGRGLSYIEVVHQIRRSKGTYRNPRVVVPLPVWAQPLEEGFQVLHERYWRGQPMTRRSGAAGDRAYQFYKGKIPPSGLLLLLEEKS